MATDRRFCRFVPPRPEFESNPVYMTRVPEGGMCLSCFLVITEGDTERVLMGHLDPRAPWDHIGALDAERAEVHSRGWMLPSSHLVLHESPKEAARRILEEQLGLGGLELSEPTVLAESGTPKRFPDLPKHWDFEFVVRGKMGVGRAPKHDAWKELRFLDLATTDRQEIARSHDEVLENVGFRFRRP